MDMLLTYLRETRTTPKAFAKLIGVDAAHFDRILAGAADIDATLAQRMVDSTGGALLLEDLISEAAGNVIDFRSRLASEGGEIDIDRLADILRGILPDLIGGARRTGDDQLPGLAAEAAANTYVALSTVTSRAGADRLAQALRPVVSEILAEMSVPHQYRARSDESIRQAVALYFQADPKTRRA
ncbi:MAG TPA: hypothetical protein PKM48_12630 [Parvularculaceae bacterium]|nr:hypothetical protein [Parvularculaceae bacterium]HNS87092.1 hypothetical protein [Parvularculaceae bacterium]